MYKLYNIKLSKPGNPPKQRKDILKSQSYNQNSPVKMKDFTFSGFIKLIFTGISQVFFHSISAVSSIISSILKRLVIFWKGPEMYLRTANIMVIGQKRIKRISTLGGCAGSGSKELINLVFYQ